MLWAAKRSSGGRFSASFLAAVRSSLRWSACESARKRTAGKSTRSRASSQRFNVKSATMPMSARKNTMIMVVTIGLAYRETLEAHDLYLLSKFLDVRFDQFAHGDVRVFHERLIEKDT